MDKEVVGVGTCRLADVTIVDDEDDTKPVGILKDHSVITLENGDIVLGIECWWMPLSTFITVNQQVLPAFGYSEKYLGVLN